MSRYQQPLGKKTIALLLCLALAVSTSLTGCDFGQRGSDPEESMMQEAPEPSDGEEAGPGPSLEVEEDPEAQSPQAAEAQKEQKEENEQQASAPAQSQTGSTTASGSTATPPATTTQTNTTAPAATNTNTSTTSGSKNTASSTSNSSSSNKNSGSSSSSNKNSSTASSSSTQAQATSSKVQRPKGDPKKQYSSVRFVQEGVYNQPLVYQNGSVEGTGITIKNKTFMGDLTITAKAGDSPIYLENVEIKGNLRLEGGGWLYLTDCEVGNMISDNPNKARICAAGNTTVWNVDIRQDTNLWENPVTGDGFKNVRVDGRKGLDLNLNHLALNLLDTRSSCNIITSDDNRINWMYAQAPSQIYGDSVINHMVVRSNGIYYDTRPGEIIMDGNYARPSYRPGSGSGSGSDPDDDSSVKTVSIRSISNKTLDEGETRYVTIDSNATSLKVTNSDRDVVGVFQKDDTLRLEARNPGRATVKIVASRSGYRSKTITFDVIVNKVNNKTVSISSISDKYMDAGDVRYLNVDTNGTAIQVTNSDRSVAGVYVDDFQLKLVARSRGTTTVTITSTRSGYKTATESFRIYVDGDWSEDSVYLGSIPTQYLNGGDSVRLNVNTDGTSIKASSSNSRVVDVDYDSDRQVIYLEGRSAGRATVTVTASRRGYASTTKTFTVYVDNDTPSAPSVSMSSSGSSYQSGSWTNDKVKFTLSGYASSRDLKVQWRKAGDSGWKQSTLSKNTWTLDNEGKWEVRFYTTGSSGSSSYTPTYTVKIDKTAPTIKSTSISTDETTATLEVSDDRSGVDRVTANNGATVQKTADGKYTVYAQKDGDITVTVTDKAGNQTKRTLSGMKAPSTDKTPPVITLDTDFTGGYTKQPMTFKFTVTDNDKVQTVKVKEASGKEVSFPIVPDGKYSHTANDSGNYTIQATDASGNSAEVTLQINLDKAAPTITNVQYNNQLLTFTAQDSESGVDPDNMIVRWNGQQMLTKPVQQDAPGSYGLKVGYQPGEYEVIVMDKAGNQSSSTLTVTSEQAADPALNIAPTIHAGDVKFSEDKRSATSTITVDTNGGTAIIDVKANGGQLALQTDGTYQFTAVADGTYTITVTNEAGKAASAQVNVAGINTTDPILDIAPTISAGNAVLSDDGKSASATITVGTNDGTAISMVDATGGSVQKVSETEYTFTATENGTYTITVTNTAGKTASAEVKVEGIVTADPIQDIEPTVSVGNAVLSDDSKSATVSITVGTNGGTAITKVEASGGSGSVQKVSETEYTFTATENGTYTITVTNTAGKTAAAEVKVEGIVTADPTQDIEPTVSVGNAVLSGDGKSANVAITVNPNGGTAITKVEASGGSGNMQKVSETEYTFTATENATYTITVTNKAGKTATMQVEVTGIVKEEPVQPQPQPQPETPDQNAVPELSASTVNLSQDKKLASAILTVDANNGTAITEVKADGGKVEPKGDNTYAFSATENGTYTITVTNKAGKTATMQVEVTGIVKEVPDTAAPQITGLAPTAQSTDYRTASFTFKVADDRGVAQVTVNGQPVTPAADGSCQFTASADGVYTVRAVDAAGNEATGSITVSGIVGEIAPTVTHNVQDNGKTAVVTIQVSENGGSPIQTVEGQGVTLSGSGSTYTFTAAENGTYTVAATNAAGKTTTHSILVDCIDTQPPVLAEGSFSVNETKSAATLSIAASDNKALASVTANGQAMTPADGGYTLAVTENQAYTIRAVDTAGNEATETITVSGIDKTQPKLEASVPTQWGKTAAVTLTASDGESGLAGAPTVSYGGQPVQVTPAGNGYTFTAAANGAYTVSVSDRAGNTATKTVTVDKVDATAPAAPVLKYDGKAVNTKAKQALTVSGDLKLDYQPKDGGSPVSAMVKVDQGEKQGQFAKKDTISFTKNGTYTITVKTVDAAGNESAPVKLTVRYEKPADPTDPQIQPPETEAPGPGTEV